MRVLLGKVFDGGGMGIRPRCKICGVILFPEEYEVEREEEICIACEVKREEEGDAKL